MPTQPQRLLELSERLLESEPWGHVDERSVFLVRIPGTQTPYAVTVFGDTVDVQGVEVALEPDGFRRLARLHDPNTTDAEVEAFKPGRALSLVFLPPGQVPPNFRKVWKAAGYRPRGSRPAPQFAATDGGDEIRPIKRSEGSILGYCVHAVLDALSDATFTPPNLSDGVESALLLTVPGDDPDAFEAKDLPPVDVDVVGWPDATGALPAPHQISDATQADGMALKQSEAIFAVTGFTSRGSDEPKVDAGDYVMQLHEPTDSSREASAVLTADPSGKQSDASFEAALLQLFKVAGERPEHLIMEDPRVALVAFPMARNLGIEPRLGHFHGEFADAVDDAMRRLGGAPKGRLEATFDALEALGGDDIPGEFPDRLESEDDWRVAYDHTSATLLLEAQASGAMADATQRYWGGSQARRRVAKLMSSLGAPQAFLSYTFEDHRIVPSGPTILEEILEVAHGNAEISEHEAALYQARKDVEVSAFEIGDDSFTITDLLTGATHSLEIDLNRVSSFGGHVVLLRRYVLGGYQAFSLAGFPLTADAKDNLVEQIRDVLGEKPTHELLRSKGEALGSLWNGMVTKLDAALKAAREGDHAV